MAKTIRLTEEKFLGLIKEIYKGKENTKSSNIPNTTIKPTDKIQEVAEDEFHNFAGLSKEDTGLGVDIFLDQCNSYKEFNHPFWLYFRNSYGNLNEYIPITILDKRVILDNSKLSIYHKDIVGIIRFIIVYFNDIVDIANGKMDVYDLYKKIKNISESSNNIRILLTEMSKLSSEMTGIPFDIWIGTNNKNHFVGVKFAPDNSTTQSNQFPEMSVPDCNIVSARDFESWRADYVKALIDANKDALIELGRNPQKYTQICNSLIKIGSDLKPIVKEPEWYPVSKSLFGYTRVKNQEDKFNFVDNNNQIIYEDGWFDIANDFRQNANGVIRAYTVLNGVEGFLYLKPIRWEPSY